MLTALNNLEVANCDFNFLPLTAREQFSLMGRDELLARLPLQRKQGHKTIPSANPSKITQR
jgi:hypothetical protein